VSPATTPPQGHRQFNWQSGTLAVVMRVFCPYAKNILWSGAKFGNLIGIGCVVSKTALGVSMS